MILNEILIVVIIIYELFFFGLEIFFGLLGKFDLLIFVLLLFFVFFLECIEEIKIRKKMNKKIYIL